MSIRHSAKTAKKVDQFHTRFTCEISHSNGMEILQGFA
jgi:hypothetical protein